jgi:PAS domain S-box-containing protein
MKAVLIEPNEETLLFFKTCLAESEAIRFQLIEAHNFSEGEATLANAQGDIAIILLSLTLPDSEGLASVSQLHKHTPTVPIVVIAERSTESLAQRALHRGAAGYVLHDDLSCGELVRTIHTAIERQALQNKYQSYLQYIHQSHARLYNIIGKSGDGIIIVDIHGLILFVNPAAAMLLNRLPEDLLGKEFGFPMVAGKRAELDILQGEGCIVVAEMNVEEIEWEGDIAYLSTLRDITSRKRSESALQQSEKRYKLLLDSVTDYIYTVLIDKETGRSKQTIHSPNCVAVTGYTAEEYDKDPYLWYRMVYEQDRHAVTQRASWILAGKSVDPLEHRIIHKNSQLIWVKNTYVLRYDDQGNLIAYDGLIADITERKRAEEQVRQLNAALEERVIKRTAQLEAANRELANEIAEREYVEQQLRKLNRAVEQSPATIVITDTNGYIEYVNPKFTQTTGYTYEEALGKNPRILKSGKFPRERYQELWQNIKEGKEWRGEFHNRRKNGELYWEFASISPIVNNEGKITHFLAVKEDITERKQAEEALMQARQIAEEATRTKSEFLANMSHEIRTPLNAIIGMSVLLKDSPLSEEQQDYVETIRICGDSLLDIINDILDFSKIEAGKLELHYAPFVLSDCIEESLEVVSTKAAEKGLELVYSIAPDVSVMVKGDTTRMRQIFVNLLSNAVKFTEQGEVVVRVSNVHPPVLRENEPDTSSTYHIQVQDTGIGIHQEHMDRLFASFSQVHQAIGSRYGGTGLGLSISRMLTEMMGGTMWAESTPGQGSTFHMTIPFEVVPMQPNQHLFCIQPELMDKGILIVDDHPTTCAVLSQWVRSWGMLVYATTDANEALTWILQGTIIDLAVLDMTMPKMDGLRLARDVRSCPGCQTLPLILTTPLGISRSFVQESGLLGMTFLLKPVKMSRLYEVLVHTLTNRHFYGESPNLLPQVAPAAQLPPKQQSNQFLRLLVAEDDLFNQKVMRLLLERIGYQPEIVSNGREVLEKVQQAPYDVILMDVLMPELDGFAATQMIRQQLPDDQQPAIIAMTAYALSGDKEQCFAAGMDGYVSKPVRIDALVQALDQVRSRTASPNTAGSRSGPYAEPAVEQPSSQSPHPPPHHPIDTAFMTEFFTAFGDTSTIMQRELISLFLDSVPGHMDALRTALAEQKSAIIYRKAHTLKSSCAQLGAKHLSRLFLHMETMGKEGTLEGSEVLLQQIEYEYQRVYQALEQILLDGEKP